MRVIQKCSRVLLRRCQSSSNSVKCTHTTKRTIHSNERLSCQFRITKTALAVESSSLRYANFVLSSTEDSLARGWDDDLIVEEDDGT
mmetsp:Transcript_14361/g.17457  ORF Transcript_14361/g.17457 Transcript_14361/m.17457 type:complete len:87 (-) Transcript_14361:92-352(-)